MNHTVRLTAVLCTTFALAGATLTRAAVFEVRKVLDSPAADSVQVVLLHKAKDQDRPIKEVLNVAAKPLLDGSAVEAARIGADLITGKPQVEIDFTKQGRQQFAQATKANLNKRLAVLVDGKVLVAPVVRTEMRHGRIVITGDFDDREAQQLVDTINKAAQSHGKPTPQGWSNGPYDQFRIGDGATFRR